MQKPTYVINNSNNTDYQSTDNIANPKMLRNLFGLAIQDSISKQSLMAKLQLEYTEKFQNQYKDSHSF